MLDGYCVRAGTLQKNGFGTNLDGLRLKSGVGDLISVVNHSDEGIRK